MSVLNIKKFERATTRVQTMLKVLHFSELEHLLFRFLNFSEVQTYARNISHVLNFIVNYKTTICFLLIFLFQRHEIWLFYYHRKRSIFQIFWKECRKEKELKSKEFKWDLISSLTPLWIQTLHILRVRPTYFITNLFLAHVHVIFQSSLCKCKDN